MSLKEGMLREGDNSRVAGERVFRIGWITVNPSSPELPTCLFKQALPFFLRFAFSFPFFWICLLKPFFLLFWSRGLFCLKIASTFTLHSLNAQSMAKDEL